MLPHYEEAAEWRATSDAYAPSLMLIKASCFPFSMITPFFTTAIKSAFRIVDNRCATITVVRFTITLSSASWTTHSDSASSALVASSRRRILGSLRIARAIATRCFCPPDSWAPRSPTSVSYPYNCSAILFQQQQTHFPTIAGKWGEKKSNLERTTNELVSIC